MCTGVMVMMATITACDIAIAEIASRPRPDASTMPIAAPTDGSFPPDGVAVPPLITSGSGRSRRDTFVNATSRTTAAKSQGPV
ncbi:MAG: hypothetical protein ACKORY_01980 [Actinomycetota bacterium]